MTQWQGVGRVWGLSGIASEKKRKRRAAGQGREDAEHKGPLRAGGGSSPVAPAAPS